MSSVRKQKERMFEENPNCRECGCLMWLNPRGKESRFRKGQLAIDKINTMVTIGHRFSRFDERRQTEPPENKQHRLICYKCNRIEERLDSSLVSIEEKWKRSRRVINWPGKTLFFPYI